MNLIYRLATESDLAIIVQLLATDALGATRENFQLPLSPAYRQAFEAILRDPQQELTVVEFQSEIIATFQLSFIQYLTYQGGLRAQLEAVRVKSTWRGQGVGTRLLEHAVQRATAKGAHLLQLTTDKKRPAAKQFYEALGFTASHEGMKLLLK